MPRWSRLIGAGLLYRRAIKLLARLSAQLDEQNALLLRVANHLAPEPPSAEPVAESVEFFDAFEGARILRYIEEFSASIGRPPSEDEVLAHLAEDATRALHPAPRSSA